MTPILLAMLVPAVARARAEARATVARAEIAQLSMALDIFELDMGRYPTAEEGLQELLAGSPGAPGGYLNRETVPKDPWGNPYVYRYPGRHNPDAYDLFSTGRDGRRGTAHDIGNW